MTSSGNGYNTVNDLYTIPSAHDGGLYTAAFGKNGTIKIDINKICDGDSYGTGGVVVMLDKAIQKEIVFRHFGLVFPFLNYTS